MAAVVDIDTDKANRFVSRSGCGAQVFGSVEELIAANVCDATMIVTPTALHRQHAEMLVRAGIASGDSEPRARRSVIDGLMRALNPPGGIKGGLYRAPVEPPNPTEPKRCA